MMINSLMMGMISTEQYNKMIKEFALTVIYFFWIMLSFFSTELVYK